MQQNQKIESLSQLDSYNEIITKKQVLNDKSTVDIIDNQQNQDSKNAQKRTKKQQIKQRLKELKNMDPDELQRLIDLCQYPKLGKCEIENCYGDHEDCPQFLHTQKCIKDEQKKGSCPKFHRNICQIYRRGKVCKQGDSCPFVHKDCKKKDCTCIFFHINIPNQDLKVYNMSYSMQEKQKYKGYIEKFEFLCENCDSYCLRAFLACGHDNLCRVCVDKERAQDNFVDKCNVCQQTISEGTYVI